MSSDLRAVEKCCEHFPSPPIHVHELPRQARQTQYAVRHSTGTEHNRYGEGGWGVGGPCEVWLISVNSREPKNDNLYRIGPVIPYMTLYPPSDAFPPHRDCAACLAGSRATGSRHHDGAASGS